MNTRKDLMRTSCQEYRKAGKKERGAILDRLAETTGMNRDYLATVLRNYGRKVQAALDGAWNGPDNYGGTFDGNGHTIRLQLSAATGSVGLFDSLASNAVVKNFTIEVSTSEAQKDSLTIDYLYFGSVIGMVSSGTTNLKIQNIKATGRLEFFRHSGPGYITLGGFIGGIYTPDTSTVIENCSSTLDIVLKDGTASNGFTSAVGGMEGRPRFNY